MRWRQTSDGRHVTGRNRCQLSIDEERLAHRRGLGLPVSEPGVGAYAQRHLGIGVVGIYTENLAQIEQREVSADIKDLQEVFLG